MNFSQLRLSSLFYLSLFAISELASAAPEKELQVLLLGDSTTEGSVCRLTNPAGPHLEDVIRLLLAAEKDLPSIKVVNRGIDGGTIQTLLADKYDQILADMPSIDYVFIRYGINDLHKRQDFEQQFPKDYQDLISRLRHDRPQAAIILATVIPYFGSEEDNKINLLIRQIAEAEKLRLFDVYSPYQSALAQGPNMLNYRNFPLDKIPKKHHAWLQPFIRNERVMIMDNRLDVHIGDLPGWYSNRHPNLAGYHVIGDATAKFLAPLIREKSAPLPDAHN